MGLDVVISGLTVDLLVINDMASLSGVDLQQLALDLLRLVPMLELHLDEAEAPASLGLPVSHDYGIGDDSKLLEVFNKVRFYRSKFKVEA